MHWVSRLGVHWIMKNHLFVCSALTKQCNFLKSSLGTKSWNSQVSLALAIPGTGLRRLRLSWCFLVFAARIRPGMKLQGRDDIMTFRHAEVQVVKELTLYRNHFFQSKYHPTMYWVSIFWCSICPTVTTVAAGSIISRRSSGIIPQKIGPKTWRQRKGVSSLVHAVGTDAELNEEEEQILKARSFWTGHCLAPPFFQQLEMIWKKGKNWQKHTIIIYSFVYIFVNFDLRRSE